MSRLLGRLQMISSVAFMLSACRDTPVPPAAVPGTYALNRRSGADTIVLDPRGTYRHRWQLDTMETEIDTGSWRLEVDQGGNATVALSNYYQWWGFAGDPDRGRQKGERYSVSLLGVEISRSGRARFIISDDDGLRYERTGTK